MGLSIVSSSYERQGVLFSCPTSLTLVSKVNAIGRKTHWVWRLKSMSLPGRLNDYCKTNKTGGEWPDICSQDCTNPTKQFASVTGVLLYLPMQKCLKMFSSTSGVVIWPPVMSASWSRQTRRSSAIRSPLRSAFNPLITRVMLSLAWMRAS